MGCIQSPPSSQKIDDTDEVSNETKDQVVADVPPTVNSLGDGGSGAVNDDEKKDIKKRLELAVEDVVGEKKQYDSVATITDENDKETGLELGASLMKSLSASLQVENDDWVLCLLEIDSDGDSDGDCDNDKASCKQVGTIIKKYVSTDPVGRKGYRLFDSGKSNLFGIVLHCSKQLRISEIQMKTLMNHIKNNCAITVSVGIAKMDLKNDCHLWRKRGMDNLNVAKSYGGDTLYSDIDIDINTNANDKNSKQEKDMSFGDKKAFQSKLEHILNRKDALSNLEWFVGVLKIYHDDDADQTVINDEMVKVSNEIIDICNILNKYKGDDDQCAGYKISDENKFLLIMKDKNGILSSQEIIDTLIGNVIYNCNVGISGSNNRVIMNKWLPSHDEDPKTFHPSDIISKHNNIQSILDSINSGTKDHIALEELKVIDVSFVLFYLFRFCFAVCEL